MSIGDWLASKYHPNQHKVIVPSDTVDLPQPMLIVANGAGNVVVVDEFGVAITYPVTVGYTIPVLAKRVNATGTTATPLIGIF